MMDADYYCPSCAFDVGECKCDKPNTGGATAMKMTEDEAIAYLRTFNAWRCGDESQEAPTPSTVTEAIRTVCDALEGARRAVPDSDDIEWPSYHHQGMGCGLEDRGITDRYEACAYGFQEAVDQCAQAFDNWLALAAAPAQPTVESIIEAFEAGRQSDDCINQYAHGTAEHTAFVHGVNHAYAIKHMLAQLTAQPAPETAGDARDAELIVHRIACALAVEDGYNPDDKACGLYDLRWSGGAEPEPVGDAFTMDYLPRAERIAAIISAKTGV